jgi:hypothetical protein
MLRKIDHYSLHSCPRTCSQYPPPVATIATATSTNISNKQSPIIMSDHSRLSNSESSSNNDRSVTFSTIEVHEHAMVLGDNPSTSHGPPVQMGWDVMESSLLSLDDYETQRPPRRGRYQLVMPGDAREDV